MIYLNKNIITVFIIINLILYLLFDFNKLHFFNDNIIGFYPLLGFLSCIVLIFLSKLISFFLKRDEKYYDS